MLVRATIRPKSYQHYVNKKKDDDIHILDGVGANIFSKILGWGWEKISSVRMVWITAVSITYLTVEFRNMKSLNNILTPSRKEELAGVSSFLGLLSHIFDTLYFSFWKVIAPNMSDNDNHCFLF